MEPMRAMTTLGPITPGRGNTLLWVGIILAVFVQLATRTYKRAASR
jgi:hypothetical protein